MCLKGKKRGGVGVPLFFCLIFTKCLCRPGSQRKQLMLSWCLHILVRAVKAPPVADCDSSHTASDLRQLHWPVGEWSRVVVLQESAGNIIEDRCSWTTGCLKVNAALLPLKTKIIQGHTSKVELSQMYSAFTFQTMSHLLPSETTDDVFHSGRGVPFCCSGLQPLSLATQSQEARVGLNWEMGLGHTLLNTRSA